MRRVLKLHPDSRCTAVSGIEAEVARPATGLLTLRFVVAGATEHLVVPPAAASVRTDELWRHTCLEAFVRGADGEAYYEFNLAPSTAWAAYRFEGYRQGMAPAEIAPPAIELKSAADGFELTAALAVPGGGTWRIGLSAVIEEKSGQICYWALAHPPGKPDFHHPDCFALELRPPDRP